MKRLISVAVVVLFAFVAATAGAQTFTMTMLGSRETAGGDPAGRGLAVITINGTNVYYFLWVQNIASPTVAHIHTGLEGVSGGVLIGLEPTWTNIATNTYIAAGSVPVDTGTTAPILQNPAAYYVNVHNSPFPNGAMRGQMIGDGPASFALANTLLGKREPAGGSTVGQGYTALILDTANTNLYYYLWETGIAAPTEAHVHTGGAGVNGGVLVGLSPTFSGGQAFGSVAVDAATLAAILASPDQYYVNIHNADFPNGALRGQLTATETDANFAVAAHNAGLGGSFFKTDARALSLTDEPATVYAEWYLHGVASATGPTRTASFVIPANGQAVYDDIVSSLFATSDRGAIRLFSSFPFLAIARNFNDQRSSGNGTYGQNEPGLGLDGALTSGALILNSNQPQSTGLGYRTNVGYFNPSPNSIDVTFNVHNPDGTLVAPPSKATFPAWDDDQALFYQFIPGIPTDQQTLANFFITFTATKPIYIFSSPVDNKTSDGMHQPAIFVPAALTQPVASQPSGPPTGTITAPPSDTSVTKGNALGFQGTGTDPKGEALTVAWDFGDGNSGTGYTATHTYTNTGVFTVKMTVTNTDGVSDPNPPTRKITVNAPQPSGPPTGTITTPAGNTSAYTGYLVNFAGSGTDPKGETLTATWDFGDGSNATGFTTTHTFSPAGVYTVTFTVKNTDGVSDPHPPTRTVTVTDYNPYPY
ncbi:MAG: CHRD domain-containing protein [Thermoanaerobaculales bacterium]